MPSKLSYSGLRAIQLLSYFLFLLVSIRLSHQHFLEPLLYRFGGSDCLVPPHHQLDSASLHLSEFGLLADFVRLHLVLLF